MKVIILSNGEFIEKEIDNTLKALQDEVGGYIEIPFLSERLDEKNIDIIINEEGKFIDGLKMEIAVATMDGKVRDVVMGNVIFASHNNDGDTIGLTEEQMKFVKKELNTQVILSNNLVRVLWI